MIKFFKRIFRSRSRFLLDNKYNVVKAFDYRGETYYMLEDPFETTAGRGLLAMRYYDELLMRCNSEFLKYYTEAIDAVLTNTQSINLPQIVRLNDILKQRLELLIAMPDHLYKLASVIFFTKEESPASYNFPLNEKKIAEWKKDKGMYEFFFATPLKTLIPYLQLPEEGTESYLEAIEKVDQMHWARIREVLYKKG